MKPFEPEDPMELVGAARPGGAPGRGVDHSDGQGDHGTVHGSMLGPNTVWLRRNGEDVGKITKRWSGVGREMFTRADTFHVEFTPSDGEPSAQPPLSESMRWTVLAAAIAIDLDFFEDRGGRRGGMGFGFGSR